MARGSAPRARQGVGGREGRGVCRANQQAGVGMLRRQLREGEPGPPGEQEPIGDPLEPPYLSRSAFNLLD